MWSGRFGRAVPEQLLTTEGILTRCSGRVAGVPTTREKRADKTSREDRKHMSLRRSEGLECPSPFQPYLKYDCGMSSMERTSGVNDCRFFDKINASSESFRSSNMELARN